MDDQRCPLEEGQAGAAEANTPTPTLEERISQSSLMASPQTEEFFDLIASSQSRRLDDQRASVGSLPGLRITHNNLGHLRGEGDPQEPGDEFFNMLIKCQSSRIDDQRCAPPDTVPGFITVQCLNWVDIDGYCFSKLKKKKLNPEAALSPGMPSYSTIASGVEELSSFSFRLPEQLSSTLLEKKTRAVGEEAILTNTRTMDPSWWKETHEGTLIT